MSPVMQFISSTFPTAKLREKHHNMLQYQLATDSLSLSKLFEAMEVAKRDFNVEDYSVSQTTLDQVFINFAKKQTDLLDEELGDNLQDAENDMNENNDGDNISAMFSVDSASTGLPSEFDEESVSGSTVDLIRPGSTRSRSSHHTVIVVDKSLFIISFFLQFLNGEEKIDFVPYILITKLFVFIFIIRCMKKVSF
ncbi:ATP-binding cassette sub- A member 1 [Bulinus truncatus]|nr:ATP-binding cassette sub- A member 1 [Bulinus truncatus]